MELTDHQKQVITYAESSQDGKTRASRGDVWVANTLANRKHYSKPNPPLIGLTAFIVGAGPSLRRNAAALKEMGGLGVIICVDASFRYLMSQGIVPDYCMSLDADGRMVDMVKGADTSRTTLLAMASGSPSLIDYWAGPKWFFRAVGGAKDLDDKLIAANRLVVATRDIKAGETLNAVEDVKVEFQGLSVVLPSGGNVTTCAHSFAHDVLRASKIVFVGSDYAWEDNTDFYCGGEHQHMGEERVNCEKVFTHVKQGGGDSLFTNFSMFSFKKWHEDVVAAHNAASGAVVINASEGGILGVDNDGAVCPGWEFMKLADAVQTFTRRAQEAVAA